MDEALSAAEKGLGFVSPNPLVGCTVVDKNHCFLSSGGHLKFGEHHAEVNALLKIEDKSQLEGATVYVTLEPCAHEGKTPSCAKILAGKPIAKVVYGLKDPNPEAKGGSQILEEAGIETGFFTTYEEKCRRLCAAFLWNQEKSLPFIVTKVAASLDGKIALGNGDSRWITGPETRLHARSLRAHYDATLIGAGTFINDNPLLDFRDTDFEGKKDNKIVILDPKGKGYSRYLDSQIAAKHRKSQVFVLTRTDYQQGWLDLGVEVIPSNSSPVGWEQSLKKLHQKGIYSLFVEGGSYAISQLIQFKLIQKIYVYQAPKILGKGKGWSDSFQIYKLEDALNLKSWESQSLGQDMLIRGWL